jgi:hypothetical protein
VRVHADCSTNRFAVVVGDQCRRAVEGAASVWATQFEDAQRGADAAKGALSALEANARRLSLTLGRALAGALLARHAQWSLDHEGDGRARAAACRFAAHGIDLVQMKVEADESAALANDTAL